MEACCAEQGPAIERPEPEAIQVTAADANLALPWDKMFDGCPFSAWPHWLPLALEAKLIWPHTRGGTDYAQWTVNTPDGPKNARPGDWVVRRANGNFDVVESELARAVRRASIGR